MGYFFRVLPGGGQGAHLEAQLRKAAAVPVHLHPSSDRYAPKTQYAGMPTILSEQHMDPLDRIALQNMGVIESLAEQRNRGYRLSRATRRELERRGVEGKIILDIINGRYVPIEETEEVPSKEGKILHLRR